MSILWVVFMYGTWSSIFSIGKWTLQFCPPIFLTAARMLLAGAILLGYLWFRNRKALKISKKQLLSLCILGVFSVYLTNIFEFWGLQHLSAAKACFIYSLSPFFSALFSYIHFKEKMTKQKWLGMLIGFLGFLPVLTTQTGSEELIGGFSFLSWPELSLMGAALCGVYGWVLLRIMVKNKDISPSMANGTSMLFGGSLALINAFFMEGFFPVASGNLMPFASGTLVMTFISNIVCYNLYGTLLKRFTATFLSFMGLLSPLFASLNSWILLGETPSPIILISTSVVAIGLWLVYRAELKQGYIVHQKAEKAAA